MSTDFTRRTRRGAALAGALAIAFLTGLGTPAARALGGEAETVTYEFSGRLDNSFSPTAPAPLLTLADSGTGHATVLGAVTDSFTVVIDLNPNHAVAPGIAPVTKTGSLVTSDGDRVDMAMIGTFNEATFDVHYVFVVTGGTGRFAGATGIGTYHVPPPTTFDPATGKGTGAEFFEGVITLPRRD
jgi:hypothetical protein